MNDWDLVSDLAWDLVSDLADEFTSALARTRTIITSLNFEEFRFRVRNDTVAFELGPNNNLVLSLGPDRDLDPVIDRARDLTSALLLAIDHAQDLILNLNRHFDRDSIHSLALALAQVHDLSRDFGIFLDRRLMELLVALHKSLTPHRETEQNSNRHAQISTAVSALRLITFTLRLLPAEYRHEYAEEFRAELYDLAQAKATTAMQILYAVQQLGRVRQLREALLSPDQPRFHRLRRAAGWILASDWRTWGLLGPLLAFGVINVHTSQGWGSALFTLPGVIGFYAGVEWLRKRWGVEVKRRDKATSRASSNE
ncbi:hypothetical protein [Streptosporangium sp. NPDC000396]|uniref:hypothetical protein n=1 Tax=Streptosporangium sp. NPDC000396 TaxID=3366185 RepID=UPI00369F086D